MELLCPAHSYARSSTATRSRRLGQTLTNRGRGALNPREEVLRGAARKISTACNWDHKFPWMRHECFTWKALENFSGTTTSFTNGKMRPEKVTVDQGFHQWWTRCRWWTNCYLTQVHVPEAQWGQTNRNDGVWNKESLVAGTQGKCGLTHTHTQIPNSPKSFSKALFKARWRSVVGSCKLLGAGTLCSGIYPGRSGHDVPVDLQEDKYDSPFCKFLSLYEWGNVIPLKIRALRMGYLVNFRL